MDEPNPLRTLVADFHHRLLRDLGVQDTLTPAERQVVLGDVKELRVTLSRLEACLTSPHHDIGHWPEREFDPALEAELTEQFGAEVVAYAKAWLRHAPYQYQNEAGLRRRCHRRAGELKR